MSERCVRSVSLAIFLVLVSTGDLMALDPQSDARRDAQHRINVSGRQRMLSQRIAKSTCLALRMPGNGEMLKEMGEARSLFISSMKALRSGSPEIGLAPEKDADLLPLIDTATELADEYEKAIDAFVAELPVKPNQEKLEAIYEMSLPLLTALNDAVEQLEAKHEDGHLIRRGLAHALNASGRQRMLSQKMSKELCMLAFSYKAQETRAHLMGSIALFESSHEALKRGLTPMKLNDSDASAISSQLALIERHWQELGKIFIRVRDGGDPTEEDVRTVASGSRSLLVELNRAVEIYETIDIPVIAKSTMSER
jgi:hypothetical protein